MAGNNILDIENASSIRRPTNIDSYSFTKFYDVNMGSQLPVTGTPHMLEFRNNNMYDWFDFGNGNLVISFNIFRNDFENLTTIKSDARAAFIDRIDLRANGTLISENNYYHKWADYSRSQFSKEYYDTVGSDMLCYDTFAWDSPNLNYDPGTGATVDTAVVPLPIGVYNGTTGSEAASYTNSQLCGFGKRFTITTQKANPTTLVALGRTVTAVIPFRLLHPFFGNLRCCLKNVEFSISVHLRDPSVMYETYTGSPTGTVVNITQAYIEIPKVVPSALRLIELDKFLYSSPKLNISYANFKVIKSVLSPKVINQHIMIDNIAQRLLRATLWITKKSQDLTNHVAVNPMISVRHLIRNLQFFVNSIPVPNTRLEVEQLDHAPFNMESPVGNQNWDTHSIYRNYLELCGANYENNPLSTENGMVTKFRNTGIYSNLGFSGFFPYFTVPLDRSRNSEEYISGSAQLSVKMELTDADFTELYDVWTVIEFQDNIRLQMNPTNAVVTYLGNNGDQPDGQN